MKSKVVPYWLILSVKAYYFIRVKLFTISLTLPNGEIDGVLTYALSLVINKTDTSSFSGRKLQYINLSQIYKKVIRVFWNFVLFTMQIDFV